MYDGYVIGNKKLLSYDDNWKSLLAHYADKDCIIDADKFCIGSR